MNTIPAWFKENIQRLMQQSPVFFKWWGRVNVALMFIGGIPTGLAWVQEQFKGIFDFSSILPHAPWIIILLKIITVMGTWGKFMTALTVTSNHEIVKDGDVLMQKPCGDLPFSEKKEGVKLVEPKQIAV